MSEMSTPHHRMVTCLNLASFQLVDMSHVNVVAIVVHPCVVEEA